MSVQSKKKQTFAKNRGDMVLGILISIIVVINFFSFLYTSTFLENTLSIIIFVLIIWTLPALKGSFRVITYSLLATAIVLFLTMNVPFIEWVAGVRVNLTLVTIISFVPLLGIPVRNGNYLEALQVYLKKLNKNIPFLYLSTQTLTHMIAVVLNVGSISIMHYLSSAANIRSTRLLVNAINRGFITALFWSPYFSAMALILSHLPIQWSSIVFHILGFVIISFIISIIIEWPHIRGEMEYVKTEQKTECKMSEKDARKKVWECFLLLSLMIISVLTIEKFTSLNMVIIICSVAVLFPLLWSAIFHKQKEYNEEVKHHIYYSLPRMKKEIVLFFVAGFFSAAFVQTNVNLILMDFINQYLGSFTIGITLMITFIIAITAVIGLHPIVTVTIFVTSFDPRALGFSDEYFAVLLLIGWGISNTISPASAVNNLLANFWNANITDVSYKWNLSFAIVMSIILPFYLIVTGL